MPWHSRVKAPPPGWDAVQQLRLVTDPAGLQRRRTQFATTRAFDGRSLLHSTAQPSPVFSPAPTGAIRSPPGCACCSRTCWSSTRRRSIRAYAEAARSIALDVIDGSTIKPLIGEDGRSPEPPDPAYQQILQGVPAADFSAEELLYLPRNVRSHRLYGMSPVEQIALTVNIALRRDAATLDYYRAAPSPDAFATLPKEWTTDQIRAVPGLFRRADVRQSRRDGGMIKFMPADFKLIETRQPPLKESTTNGWRGSSATPSRFPPRRSSARSIARPPRCCACRRRRKGWCR